MKYLQKTINTHLKIILLYYRIVRKTEPYTKWENNEIK